MPIDRRLREGLERYARVVDPDLRQTLPDAIERGRRRGRSRRASQVAAILICAIAVAVVSPRLIGAVRNERTVTIGPVTPKERAYEEIAGTYTASLEPDTNLPLAGMVGKWTLELTHDGSLFVSPPPSFGPAVSPASFRVEGDRFQTNAFGTICDGTLGTYAWALSEGRLRFVTSDDPCPLRESIFGVRQWARIEGARAPSPPPGQVPVMPDDGSTLEPGMYATAFQPSMTFSVTDGWTGNSDSSDFIDLRQGLSDRSGALSVFRIESVIDPRTHRIRTLPRDLVGWFTTHPALNVLSTPKPAMIGGIAATQLDVELDPTWKCGDLSCPRFAPLSPGEPSFGWSSVAAPALRARLFVLDIHGEAVIVEFASARSGFAEGRRAANVVLATIRFP